MLHVLYLMCYAACALSVVLGCLSLRVLLHVLYLPVRLSSRTVFHVVDAACA